MQEALHKFYTGLFSIKDLLFFLKCLLKVPKSSSKSYVFGSPCIWQATTRYVYLKASLAKVDTFNIVNEFPCLLGHTVNTRLETKIFKGEIPPLSEWGVSRGEG